MEKASEFFNCELKLLMQKGKLYIKDSSGCINKNKSISDSEFLVAAYVVGLCPSIPHEGDLRAIKEALGNRDSKIYTLIST